MSHATSFTYFQQKCRPAAAKAACFLSPISLIGVACAGFSKTFLYQRLPLLWRLLLTLRSFWFIEEKIDCVCRSFCSHIWDINRVCDIAIHESSNVKPSYSIKCQQPALSWLHMENYLAP